MFEVFVKFIAYNSFGVNQSATVRARMQKNWITFIILRVQSVNSGMVSVTACL